MVRYLPISNQRLDEIRAETRKDQSLRELSETILVGWPENMQGRCSNPYTPLLQHARRPDRTRWAGFQREFRRDTEEPSRRYEAEDSLVPPRNRGMSEACTRMHLLARHVCRNEAVHLRM